jgi:metallo-beta-lactamase family protein
VFSGDIGRKGMPILKNPVTVPGANYIIMEATYGDRSHVAEANADEILLEAVQRTLTNHGKLIIPAFSVGRTQEIVYRLNLLWEWGRLPKIKVFVDSPLAVNAFEVFRDHVECFDQEMIDRILAERDQDPLKFEHLHYIRSVESSKMLNEYHEPCVIIASSGMCEGGRVLHHLKNHIEKSSTTILFAGFQAPNTLGRQIQDGNKFVKIFGKPYEVRAHVCRLENSSGHADREGLLEWARSMNGQGDVRRIALVHCELAPAIHFKDLLNANQINPVIIPARGESMSLEFGRETKA